ncbi:MAG TPA: hypothetical protein DDY28_06375, partial [Hyphomonas atlantica]|nr:hypothetical protein [Hyphomonas atlantica]
VSPIYMPGRLRTASRPFRTLIEPAPYSGDSACVPSAIKASSSIRGFAFIYRGFDAQRPQMRGGICSPENSFKTGSCGPIWPAGRPSADGRGKKVSKNPGIRGDSGGYESLQIRVSGLDPEPLAAGCAKPAPVLRLRSA